MVDYANKLGPPQIRLEGLQIWVHSRQFPEATDYWDGNWINVTVHCGAKGADVWTSGAIIHLPEIKGWADACEQMYKTLSGEAKLDCMEPELSIEMKMREQGHIEMEVYITPDHLIQEHRFRFEIDQSYLTELVNGCRAVLEAYPIRNGKK
jgi:hypothetical protein